jgi:hypothetical protein
VSKGGEKHAILGRSASCGSCVLVFGGSVLMDSREGLEGSRASEGSPPDSADEDVGSEGLGRKRI